MYAIVTIQIRPTTDNRAAVSAKCQFVSRSPVPFAGLIHSGWTKRCGQYRRIMSASVAPVEERYEAKPSGLSAQSQIAAAAVKVAAITMIVGAVRCIV